MTININWPGLAGRTYTFETYPIGTAFHQLPGVYIFCKPAGNGQWNAIYVGETDNFDQRLNTALKGHQSWPSCAWHGATHLSVLIVRGDRANRLRIETELRHSLNPPCNRQAA